MSAEFDQVPAEPVFPERRGIPPWLLVCGAAVVLFAGFTGLVIVAALLQDSEPAGATSRPVIQEVTMPDGTILALEKVTYGTTHRYEFETDGNGFWDFGLSRRVMLRESTPNNDAVMLWFSRRHPATGEPLDFDWWSHCVAIDAHGCRFEDFRAGRNARFQHGGSSGVGGSRPFHPVSPGRRCAAIIAHSAVRPLRHAGKTFKLEVYDTGGTKVATFDVPDPGPSKGKAPTWKPDPLPITRRDGNVSVTLTDVTAKTYERTRNGRKQERVRLRPHYEIKEDDEPTSAWSVRSGEQLLDPLGNTSRLWDCELCPNESAWKLNMKLYRGNEAEFSANEVWSVTGVAVPERDKSESLGRSTTLSGVTLELLAVGGPGKVAYSRIGRTRSGYSSSGSLSFRGPERNKRKRVRYRIESGGRHGHQTSVECDIPHIVVRTRGLTGDHRLTLQVADGQDRPVEAEGPRQLHSTDLKFWYLDVPAGVTTLDLRFVVQEARNFEFTFKPPEIAKRESP